MTLEQRNIIVIDLKAFYSFVECVDRGLDPWSTPLVVADKERGKKHDCFIRLPISKISRNTFKTKS